MTEAGWLACADSDPMFEFAWKAARERKSRMFALACCHRLFRLMNDPRAVRAMEVAERAAEGVADEAEIEPARMGNFALYFEVKPVLPPALGKHRRWKSSRRLRRPGRPCSARKVSEPHEVRAAATNPHREAETLSCSPTGHKKQSCFRVGESRWFARCSVRQYLNNMQPDLCEPREARAPDHPWPVSGDSGDCLDDDFRR
jgi:hypothetical protein